MNYLTIAITSAAGTLLAALLTCAQPAKAAPEPLCSNDSLGVMADMSAEGYRVEGRVDHKDGSSSVLATTADGRYVFLWIQGSAICVVMAGDLKHVNR